MTLTGTLIFGENGEITPLPARTTDQDLIKAMMEGGNAKIYHCNDSDKCLKVVADATVTIASDKGGAEEPDFETTQQYQKQGRC